MRSRLLINIVLTFFGLGYKTNKPEAYISSRIIVKHIASVATYCSVIKEGIKYG
ncbi:hypothetical protein GCM10009411_04220 [Shewanella litoralis]|uniref:Uncharacterized protein n=1 Tax=Shewanella litoralis TaxID=2282700 RepID=A0ABQ2QZU7_9GAMM|nr:hypothetical protein GCM10009411_04220 [Shewanella litoralis]